MTNRQQRIAALVELGRRLSSDDETLKEVKIRAQQENPWFTQQNIDQSLSAICSAFLDESVLSSWLPRYPEVVGKPQKVGLILPGNIPLVGFHDVLCVYVSGHHAMIKYSSKDSKLMQYIIDQLHEIEPTSKEAIAVVERLKDYDAVIATGSNNSGRYFREYFAHVPNIIRKNRNAVAVLTGDESKADFIALGRDIFTYFGLGCRNVSKIYVPEGYNFSPMLEALHDEYKELVLHHKYKNNFDFNHALFMLNKENFLMNGCLMVKESKDIPSRISSVNYEYYSDSNQLAQHLRDSHDAIQCVVSGIELDDIPVFAFGKAQEPAITDYADGVDTMTFLTDLYA